MKMEEHLGFPTVEVNIDPHFYIQEEEVIEQTGSELISQKLQDLPSSQQVVVKIDIETDNQEPPAMGSQPGNDPTLTQHQQATEPIADGPPAHLRGELNVAAQEAGELSRKERVLLKNIQDLLLYAGQGVGVDGREVNRRLEKAMSDYMHGPKWQEGRLQYEVGSVVAPEDMEMVLKQIQEEFAKLENIREVFQVLNMDESLDSDSAINSPDSQTETGNMDSSIDRDAGKEKSQQQQRPESIPLPVEENKINKDEL